MKPALSSWSDPWAVGVPGREPADPLDVRGLLDAARHLAVGVVQIADNMPLHAMDETEHAELLDRANQCEVDLEVGTVGIERDHLLGYLAIARRLRAPFV